MGHGFRNGDTHLGKNIEYWILQWHPGGFCIASYSFLTAPRAFFWLLINIGFYIFTELLLLQDSYHVLFYLHCLLFGIFHETSVPAGNLAELSLCATLDLGWVCAVFSSFCWEIACGDPGRSLLRLRDRTSEGVVKQVTREWFWLWNIWTLSHHVKLITNISDFVILNSVPVALSMFASE